MYIKQIKAHSGIRREGIVLALYSRLKTLVEIQFLLWDAYLEQINYNQAFYNDTVFYIFILNLLHLVDKENLGDKFISSTTVVANKTSASQGS